MDTAQDQSVDLAVDNISDEQIDSYFSSKGDENALRIRQDEAESGSQSLRGPEGPAREASEVSEEDKRLTAKKAGSYDGQTPKYINDDGETLVTVNALHQSRKTEQEARQRLREYEEKVKLMESRFNEIQKRFSQPEPEVNFDDDPLLALKTENDKLRSRLDELTGSLSSSAEQANQQRQVQAFAEHVRGQYEEYINHNNDFLPAYKHLMDSRSRQLADAGYSNREIQQIVVNEEFMIAQKAFSDGKNPGEVIYKMAKSMGYNRQATEDGLLSDTELQNQGSKKASNDVLDKVEKGLATNKQVSGNAPSQGLSLEALAAMDGPEFDKYWDSFAREQKGGSIF